MSKDDVDGRANVGVTKDGAKQDGQKALEGLKTLGTLLVTNGQFRKLRESMRWEESCIYADHARSQRRDDHCPRYCGGCVAESRQQSAPVGGAAVPGRRTGRGEHLARGPRFL